MENINVVQIENKLIASSFYSMRNLIKKAKQYQGIDLRIMLAFDDMYIGHNLKERMTVSLDDLCRRYYLKEKWHKVTPAQRENVKRHVLKLMQGQTAMQDTMAQAAALTGGYGNSYAAAVGNQAYQNYITQANNNIPAFQQMAMNVWQSGLDQLMNQYNAGTQQLNNLLNLDAQALARWQANEKSAYNEWLAGYNQVNDQYGTGKDYYSTLMALANTSGGSGSGSSGNKASTTSSASSTSKLPASVQNVLNNATQAQIVTAEDWVKLLDAANKKK